MDRVSRIQGAEETSAIRASEESTTGQNSNKKTSFCNAPCCFEPMDVFAIASSISLLLYKELNICQLSTLINLITLILSNLSAFVSQAQINEGVEVQPPLA